MAETGESIEVTSSDHLLATAEFAGGAVASIHLHDAEAALPRTRLEIAGTAGDLALVSAPEPDPWAAQLQVGRWELATARPGEPGWRPVPGADDGERGLPTSAVNVARLYAQLAADLRDGTRMAPGFATAHALHALIERATAPRA